MIWFYQIALIILAAVLLGILYQSGSTLFDEYRYPPLGKLVDIGGYKLHLNSTGMRGPTVVLDAGMGGTSLGWSLVQTEVSKFTRVCSYDRAGYAWSEESSTNRTSVNIAEELHTLLHEANIPGPYILVGHSFGGGNVLLFAHRFPEETVGVILVDSIHEEMLKKLPTPSQGILNSLWDHPFFQWFRSIIGCTRITSPSEEIKQMFHPLPEKIRLMYIAQMNKTSYTNTVAREMESFEESLFQLEAADIHLGDKPLIVITAGKFSNRVEAEIWKGLQTKLLLKSNRSKQIIAEKSDHMINHHQPKVIIGAILELAK